MILVNNLQEGMGLMKKIKVLIILFSVIFLLTGCGSSTIDKCRISVQNDYYAILNILQEASDRQSGKAEYLKELTQEEITEIKKISARHEDWSWGYDFPTIKSYSIYNKYEKEIIWRILDVTRYYIDSTYTLDDSLRFIKNI